MKSNKLVLTCLILVLIVGISEARWGRRSSSSRSRGGFFGSIFKVFSKVKIPKVHHYGGAIASAAQRHETPARIAPPIKESQAQRKPMPVLSPRDRPDTPVNVIPIKNPKPQKYEDITKFEVDQDHLLEDYPSNSNLMF